MISPTQQEFKNALDDLKKVLCGDTAIDWFEKYANTDNSLVMNCIKFAMACNGVLPKEIYEYSAMLQENTYKGVDYFDAMTAKIWEEIE